MTDERLSRTFRASFPTTEMGFRTAAWNVSALDDIPGKLQCHSTLEALLLASREPAGIRLYDEQDSEGGTSYYQSYGDLYAAAGRMAGALRAQGIRRGDCVVLLLPTGFDFVRALFALQWLGAIPVPTYPPAAMEKVELGLDRISHIASNCAAVALLTNSTLARVMGDIVSRVKSIDHVIVAEQLSLAHPAPPVAAVSLDDTCFVQYTSGSTGLPKGVQLTHRNILCNLHAIGLGYQINHSDKVCSWLPLYHDMGLIGGLFNPIYWRIPVALMSPMAFLMKPSRWLRMISENGSTITAAPNFGYGLVAKRTSDEERATLDLSAVRIALSGAEPVNVKTVDDFCESFAASGFRREALFPAYGLAESSLGVCFGKPGAVFKRMTVDRDALASGNVVLGNEGEQGTLTLACVGKALAGHHVNIVDENGESLDYGQVGHIVVSGPSIMAGYYNNPVATAKVLQDGNLWTGDLGFLEKEGLYVTGRAKDLIIVRGKNFYAEDIERCMELHPDTRPSGAVAFAIYDQDLAKDAVICVVETKVEDLDARTRFADALSESVSITFGIGIQEIVLVAPGTIPRTSSGKRQRSLTRERYLAGSLEKQETRGLRLAYVFARSAVGFLALQGRKLSGRRVPEREE